MSVRYGERYVHGDFNHDELQDAAVMIVENTGGNQDWYTLAFLINNGEQLIHHATIYLDDRAIINSLREQNGRVLICMSINRVIVMEGRVNASENGMNIRVGMCLLVGSVPIYLENSRTASKGNPVESP